MRVEVLCWKRIIQSKRGIPYIYLSQNLSPESGFYKGREVDCKIVVEKGKVRLIIDLI